MDFKQIIFTNYSTELVNLANLAHRLYVQYCAIESQDLYLFEDDTPSHFYKFHLEGLLKSYQQAHTQFLNKLIEEDPRVTCVVDEFNPHRPYDCVACPEEYQNIFKYFQPKEERDKIIEDGGYKVGKFSSFDTNIHSPDIDFDNAIDKRVPLDFIQIFYPMIGGYDENGFIDTSRLAENVIIRVSLEE